MRSKNVRKKTIKIAVPLTSKGIFAPHSDDAYKGIVMAVEDINRSDGLLGQNVECHVWNTGLGSAEGMAIACDRFMEYAPDLIFGGLQNDPDNVKIFGGTGVPYFNNMFSMEMIRNYQSNTHKYWNYIDIGGTEKAYSASSYRLLNHLIPNTFGYEYPNKKVALQVLRHSTATTIVYILKEMLLHAGWDIVYEKTHPWQQTDWTSQLAMMRSERPSLIFFSSWGLHETISFLDQFLKDPWDALFATYYGPSSPEFINVLGEKANGVLWEVSTGLIPTPQNLKWVQRFFERWGQLPGKSTPIWSYDIVMWWAKAVTKVGDPKDYRGIVSWILNNVYFGLCGPYAIEALTNHQIEDETGITLRPFHSFQIQNKTDELLFLGGLAQHGAKFIVPPWITR